MRAWLHENNLDPEERDFFKNPFTWDELLALLAGHSPGHIFSWKSPSFKATGLSGDTLDDAELLRLMLKEPRLIRRPLVQAGNRLIIGADWAALATLLP